MKLQRRDGADSEQTDAPRQEPPETSGKSSRRREISVIIYTTILFAVALALILLSYAMQKNTNTAISSMSVQHGEFSSQAMRNIEQLQTENQTLSRELDASRTLVALMSSEPGPQRERLLEKMKELAEYLDEDALGIYNSVLDDFK